jgi:hypothetical protein
MDDGQKTPCGHPDFNSYIKIQRVFIDNRQTDDQTNGQTDGEINPVQAATTSQKRKAAHLGVCRLQVDFFMLPTC